MSDSLVTYGVGEREILDESLWSGITIGQASVAAQCRRAEAVFARGEDGIWLPDVDVAADDAEVTYDTFTSSDPAELLLEPQDYDEIVETVGRLSLTTAGCWVADGVEYPGRALSMLARNDVGRQTLERGQVLPKIRQCDTADCLYHRHYDFTFMAAKQRRHLQYPNLANFEMHGDHVRTAWGDELPSIEDSRLALRDFQRKCFPFVAMEDSLLTPHAIAQIVFIPGTGCWFNKNYYLTPVEHETKKWQFDGYGRLRIPKATAERLGLGGTYTALGHRVTWLLLGHESEDFGNHVLNHKCGFRPCCNPGHMEKIKQDDNVRHGVRMRRGANGQQQLPGSV